MQRINNAISFTGTRQVLRDADWICRKTSSAFPMISPTKIYFSNPERILKNRKFTTFLWAKSLQLQEDRKDRRFLKSPFKFLSEVLYSACNHKVGNCSEFVSIAEMIAKMNGVKNCYRVSMTDLNKSGKLDHTALLVTKNPIDSRIISSKESIIIDPWLGISGRAADVVTRYEKEFSKILGLSGDTAIGFRVNKSLDLSGKELDILRTVHPDLIFKKKDNSKGFMRFA